MVWRFVKFRDRSIERREELEISLLRLWPIPHFVQMRHKCVRRSRTKTATKNSAIGNRQRDSQNSNSLVHFDYVMFLEYFSCSRNYKRYNISK